MDPASVAKRTRQRKYYHQRLQNETEDERQERIASRKKYMKEYCKNLKPDQKEGTGVEAGECEEQTNQSTTHRKTAHQVDRC